MIPFNSRWRYSISSRTDLGRRNSGIPYLKTPPILSLPSNIVNDGKTNDYKNGSYLKTDIRVKAGAKTYIDFEYEGSYENTVETMELDVIHREKAPFYVQLDGKEVPHFLHRRKYEESDIGWYYSQTKKSVQVKYPNPKKNHQVLISFEVFDMIGM